MQVSEQFVYLIATIPFCLLWVFIFIKRKDLRKEMLMMSFILGVASVITSYYFWTIDWWRPLTITGTKVGIEDFITGFASGGIMATIYEVVFRRSLYKRKLHHHASAGFTIVLLLAQATMWLMSGVGLTSFYASAVAMILVAIIILSIRKDLVMSSVISGLLVMLVSVPSYLVILLICPQWIDHTYLQTLSGIKALGIPIEEFIFWFLSGLVFGPFYEYWQGERLKRLTNKDI